MDPGRYRVSQKYIQACRKKQDSMMYFWETLNSRKKRGKTQGKPGQEHGGLRKPTKATILYVRIPS